VVVERLPRWARASVLVTGGLVVAVVGYWVLRGDKYEPASTPIERFEMVDDSTVILHYTTGGCSGGIHHVDQDVSERQIVVTLWDRRQVTGDCEDWGAEATHQIELDEALLDRLLLDGFCDSPKSSPETCPGGRVPTERPTTHA
jgi:hypothetical protein